MAKKKAGKKKAAKPKKEAKRKGKEKQVYTKMLRVDLTAAEKREAAEAMARAVQDLRAIEADKKKVVDDFKAKEAACHAALVTNANLGRDGYDMRDVMCEELRDFSKGTLTVTRTDTWEVIEERELKGDEKQMSLLPEEEARL